MSKIMNTAIIAFLLAFALETRAEPRQFEETHWGRFFKANFESIPDVPYDYTIDVKPLKSGELPVHYDSAPKFVLLLSQPPLIAQCEKTSSTTSCFIVSVKLKAQGQDGKEYSLKSDPIFSPVEIAPLHLTGCRNFQYLFKSGNKRIAFISCDPGKIQHASAMLPILPLAGQCDADLLVERKRGER